MATLALDRVLGLDLPVPTGNAQTLLGALAGAVLTIAVFTVWMRTVVVGLAAGNVSPRVVASYLHDDFQQRVTGWMIAAFAYLVAVVAFLPAGSAGSSDRQTAGIPAVSSLTAVLVVVVALLTVLLAIRQGVSTLSLSHLVRTLADRALEVMRDPHAPDDPPPPGGPPATTACRILGPEMGWVQHIDYQTVIETLPAGATLTMHAAVGDFVAPGELMATSDAELDGDTVGEVLASVSVAKARDATHDLAFAIEQLVDVAEHAMSPSSNDTSTAEEALVHLRVVLRALIRNGKYSGCLNGDDGRCIVSTDIWDPADHLDNAFERLCRDAPHKPSVMRLLRETLRSLETTAAEVEATRSGELLRRHRERLEESARDGRG